MKNLLLAFSLCLFCGCVKLTVSKRTTATETNVQFSASAPIWTKRALQGLNVDGVTKTTSSLLKANSDNSEPNAESITATGEALGNLIGTAAAAAAKGAKP